MSQFDEPDLLDDLVDHWNSPGHKDERRFLVEHLQMLGKAKGVRMSVLSGEVRGWGVGGRQPCVARQEW
jgi:hypothetical protein